jgi:hypothetical protein
MKKFINNWEKSNKNFGDSLKICLGFQFMTLMILFAMHKVGQIHEFALHKHCNKDIKNIILSKNG